MIVDILWMCHASSCQRNVQQILEEEIPVTINMTSFLLVFQNSCVFVARRGVYYLTLNSAILYSLSWLKSCAETHIPGVTQHAGVQAQTRAYITLGNVISNGTSLWIRRDLAWLFTQLLWMLASGERSLTIACSLKNVFGNPSHSLLSRHLLERLFSGSYASLACLSSHHEGGQFFPDLLFCQKSLAWPPKNLRSTCLSSN